MLIPFRPAAAGLLVVEMASTVLVAVTGAAVVVTASVLGRYGSVWEGRLEGF
jgi:hypothetical protein